MAQAQTIDFVNGTWDHSAAGGSATSKGWDSTYTTGKSYLGDGLYITMEATAHGTANFGASNLINTGFDTPVGGFAMENKNFDGQDFNSSGKLENYQEWRFTFSRPVKIEDWRIGDIDSLHYAGWIDAVAMEGWKTAAGAVSTGLQPTYNFGPGTNNLKYDTSTLNIGYFARDIESFGWANPQSNAGESDVFLDFGDTFVTGVSVYLFNNNKGGGGLNHAVVIDGTLGVPEPSIALLGLFSLPLVFRRKR